MENRILNMSIMRKGYGIHPERDIVLLDEAIATSGEYDKEIEALTDRYLEADFIVMSSNEELETEEDGRLYILHNLSDDEKAYLESLAKGHCKEGIAPSDFVEQVQEVLVKEGYTREGTTLLRINDDDTTERIDVSCSHDA